VFIAEKNAGTSAAGDNDDDDDDDDKKRNEANSETMTSEYRRQRKVIYEVIV